VVVVYFDCDTETCSVFCVFQPELPHAPTSLVINSIEARQARLQFIPGFSGNTFISLWIVEAQKNYDVDDDSWSSIYNISDPDAVSITVPTLQPHAAYSLRLTAVNIVGQSPPSEPSDWFNTLQAKPSEPPTEVLVRPVNETALHVRWAVCYVTLLHWKVRCLWCLDTIDLGRASGL